MAQKEKVKELLASKGITKPKRPAPGASKLLAGMAGAGVGAAAASVTPATAVAGAAIGAKTGIEMVKEKYPEYFSNKEAYQRAVKFARKNKK